MLPGTCQVARTWVCGWVYPSFCTLHKAFRFGPGTTSPGRSAFADLGALLLAVGAVTVRLEAGRAGEFGCADEPSRSEPPGAWYLASFEGAVKRAAAHRIAQGAERGLSA